MIITIDGPSGTGKSTVAKGVAASLGFIFFDTGAMYRSLAWFVQKEGISSDDRDAISALLPRFSFEIKTTSQSAKQYWVNGTEITHLIRSQEISNLASQIAIIPQVREALVKIQRRFGRSSNAVFEGRDMGTVVFPEADLKIFLTAKAEVRAQRRYRELISKFSDLEATLSFEQILKEIEERDHTDMSREISPLKQAADAILIDTSELSVEQVILRVIDLYKRRSKLSFPRMKFSYWLVYSLAKCFFRTLFGLKIYGLEHYRSGAAILASNHTSLYDPEVVSISCPEEVHFLAKESLFRIPLLGRLIRVLNSHPVSRDASDAATFRLIIRLLQKGNKVILFPEGNRSYDGDLQPLERGLPFLVQKAQCRIIPVYVSGTFEAWPRTRSVPKCWGRISCTFGSPIEWAEFEELEKKEAMQKINERTFEALRNLKGWVEAGARGLPP